MAVRLKRAHAEFFGQCHEPADSDLLLGSRRWGISMRRNVAQEVQGIRLMAAFLVRTGERQRSLGQGRAPLPSGRRVSCASSPVECLQIA